MKLTRQKLSSVLHILSNLFHKLKTIFYLYDQLRLFLLLLLADSRRCSGIYNFFFYNLRDQLLPSIYPWLRNRCLAINISALLVSADMSYVPVDWQRPGWNIHISSDISALWTECHISPCLYSSLYLYNPVNVGNETIPFTER
jgi:hypothetical protein